MEADFGAQLAEKYGEKYKKTSIEAFSWMSDRALVEGYSCWIRKQVREVYTFLSSKKFLRYYTQEPGWEI